MSIFHFKGSFKTDDYYRYDSSFFQMYYDEEEGGDISVLSNHFHLVVSDGWVQQGVVTPEGLIDVRNIQGIASGYSYAQIHDATWMCVLGIGNNPFYNEYQLIEKKVFRFGIPKKDAIEQAQACIKSIKSVLHTVPRLGDIRSAEYEYARLEGPAFPWEAFSHADAVRFKNGIFEIRRENNAD